MPDLTNASENGKKAPGKDPKMILSDFVLPEICFYCKGYFYRHQR